MDNTALVVGSINMDLVVSTEEIPGLGETVLGNSITENPGGKGANQGVAISKLGKRVNFLGMEIPLESVKFGLELAKKLGKITVLNPAPAADLDDDILKNVDILIPNEHELKRISKMEVVDEGSSVKAARLLIEKGVKKVIVTLGANGVLYVDENQYKLFPSYNVEVVDTTAAGDSFIGGFVSSYMVEKNVEAAIERGQKTAALCIQRLGAQNAMPTRQEVEGFKRI